MQRHKWFIISVTSGCSRDYRAPAEFKSLTASGKKILPQSGGSALDHRFLPEGESFKKEEAISLHLLVMSVVVVVLGAAATNNSLCSFHHPQQSLHLYHREAPMPHNNAEEQDTLFHTSIAWAHLWVYCRADAYSQFRTISWPSMPLFKLEYEACRVTQTCKLHTKAPLRII